MKKYMAFIAAALTFFACQPQQPDGSQYAPAPKLPVSTGTVQFESDGGRAYVGVTTQETIEAFSNREWATVTVGTYGINISTTQNEDIETRYAVVTVRGGELLATVQVVQYGYNSKYIWDEEYDFPYAGGTLQLLYKTDATVKITVEGSEWIEAVPDNGVLTITVAQNPTKEERAGFVTYEAGEDVRSFIVMQAKNPSGGGGGGGDDPEGPVLFSEDFEDINTLAEWMLLDADGDGNNWIYDDGANLAAHSGTGKLYSQSYNNESGPLTPDNWVFTPGIRLASSDNYLSFWVCPQDGAYPQEHYAAYVTETDPMSITNPVAECTKVVEGTLTKGYTPASVGPMASGEWENVLVKIPDTFNGKTVYIAVRHFDCTDMFYINLDDLMVTKGEPNTSSASVFAAPANAPVSSYLRRK